MLCGLVVGQQCAPEPEPPGDAVEQNPRVTLRTTMGDIVIELFPTASPQTVAGFMAYVENGFYPDTIFHDVRSAAITGGTFTADLERKPPGDAVPNESASNRLLNLRGRVALVAPDGPDSGTSQFVILLANDPDSDFDPETNEPGRTVFGRVAQGLDVADDIGGLTTTSDTAGDGTELPRLPSDTVEVVEAFVSTEGQEPEPPEPGENEPPVADAGDDRDIRITNVIRLDAGGSRDPNLDELTYAWSLVTEGIEIDINDADGEIATFTVPELPEGMDSLTFSLTVQDPSGRTGSDEVTYTIHRGPFAHLLVMFEGGEQEIVIELFDDEAPNTVQNFVQYVQDGFFDGTLIHRTVPEFVIQGGGFLPGLIKPDGLRDPIANEFGEERSNIRTTVAMAKLASDPDSATSQFFISLVDNSSLDTNNEGFTVFGRVTAGMDIVDRMSVVETETGMDDEGTTLQNVPVEDIVVTSATFEELTDDGDDDEEPEFITTSSGLMYRDVVVGSGGVVTPEDTLRVLYTGRFDNENGEIFDSTDDRGGDPAEFSLMGVIEGWMEGLGNYDMRVGGKRELIIPPDLAYGDAGTAGIPPNSTLWFEVEVLDILP